VTPWLISRAKHYLQLQVVILQLLFIVLVQTPDRKAATSHALIRGTLLSSFGTMQATRQYWEADSECDILQDRIRDNLILIAIEAMSVSSALSPSDPEEGSLLGSKAHIEFVHQLMIDASEGEYDEDTKIVHHDESSPISLLCLAWSITLRCLPANLAPSFSQGEDATPYQEIASRAFDSRLVLFGWIERILIGPLFTPSEDEDINSVPNRKATNRKRLFKGTYTNIISLLTFRYACRHDRATECGKYPGSGRFAPGVGAHLWSGESSEIGPIPPC
jgi:nuclear pore complex protein Nup188